MTSLLKVSEHASIFLNLLRIVICWRKVHVPSIAIQSPKSSGHCFDTLFAVNCETVLMMMQLCKWLPVVCWFYLREIRFYDDALRGFFFFFFQELNPSDRNDLIMQIVLVCFHQNVEKRGYRGVAVLSFLFCSFKLHYKAIQKMKFIFVDRSHLWSGSLGLVKKNKNIRTCCAAHYATRHASFHFQISFEQRGPWACDRTGQSY